MNAETTLAQLLQGWLDGGLSAAEEAELLRQLEEDPQLRRRFAEHVATLGATRAAADSNPRWLALFDLLDSAPAFGDRSKSFEGITMGRIESARQRSWHTGAVMWGLAAAFALLLAGVFLLNPPSSGPASPAGPGIARGPEKSVESSPVAVVIASSAEAEFGAGTYLKRGAISQTHGWLTLQTLNGVSVTLDAPFEVSLLNHDRIHLQYGRARVKVPEGAEGFRLESPSFDVVDLGTEFAALVHADGTGTCRVFEGEADVSLLDSIGEVKRTHRLSAKESVRISPSRQAMLVIDETDDAYPGIKGDPRPRLRLAPSYAADVMAMAPAGYWRFEEIRRGNVINEVPDGVRLQAAGSATISAEGAGNHSGDLTQSERTGFFQIPTRTQTMLQGDFSVSLFAQFSWLQNFALISASRYDKETQGHSFILQSSAAFRRTDSQGSALHAIFRDPPAWDGGREVYGNTEIRPLHWHHIAATRREGTVSLFLDGARIATESVGGMPLDCRQIFVGRLNGNTAQTRMEARGLVGRIDELAIFPRALSDEEIRRLATP